MTTLTKCKHAFKKHSYNFKKMTFCCTKCNTLKSRKTTEKEKQIIDREWHRREKRAAVMHKDWWDFVDKFGANDNCTKWKKRGYKLMTEVRDFAKTHRSIKTVTCDDASHATSELVLIPHKTRSEYWGTSIVVIPQCTGEDPTVFFLYPENLENLRNTLSSIHSQARK